MTHHKSFKNESQDKRRHDQQHAVHPSQEQSGKDTSSRETGRKQTKKNK